MLLVCPYVAWKAIPDRLLPFLMIWVKFWCEYISHGSLRDLPTHLFPDALHFSACRRLGCSPSQKEENMKARTFKDLSFFSFPSLQEKHMTAYMYACVAMDYHMIVRDQNRIHIWSQGCDASFTIGKDREETGSSRSQKLHRIPLQGQSDVQLAKTEFTFIMTKLDVKLNTCKYIIH